jgi:hypothetical protein
MKVSGMAAAVSQVRWGGLWRRVAGETVRYSA